MAPADVAMKNGGQSAIRLDPEVAFLENVRPAVPLLLSFNSAFSSFSAAGDAQNTQWVRLCAWARLLEGYIANIAA